MRVLHVFKDYFPPTRGGIEQYVHDVVHSMEGFELAVLTSSRSRRHVDDLNDGVPVTRAPEYARPVSTPVTPSWARLLRETGADLIHFHMPNPFGELMYLASRTAIPMVASYHADIVGRRALLPLFRPFQQRFLSAATRVLVSNPRMLETSEALAGHRDRAVVVPYGVDPEQWRERPAAADELRARYPGPLILSLGRLVYYKGLDHLIRAMQGTEATALLAGDGPKRAELEALAAACGVREKVVFAGEIPDEDRAAHYHAADVFAFPSTSRAEAFGIAMLQAMACGTPAISTELGTGTSWVNVHGETGLVIPPRDPAALAEALQSLLADDAGRRAMGEAAARRVRERFTKAAMLEALAAVYRSPRGGITIRGCAG